MPVLVGFQEVRPVSKFIMGDADEASNSGKFHTAALQVQVEPQTRNKEMMKRINKIILILMLPLMVELIVSCCDCLETIFFDYTNCSLTINNLDNSDATPIIAQSKSISKKAYGIRVSINRSENICEVERNNSLFIQSAYATSCDCPPESQYMALDSIVSVAITTCNDFDSEHLGCSDVSELFYVFERNEFTSIPEYIGNVKTELYDFMNPTFEFDLLLMSPPTIGIEHQFEVTIELSDGRILNAQTGIIELN
ncbi:MAG: DUF5034 domain-containing protein [Mangrovibacterium sp.]